MQVYAYLLYVCVAGTEKIWRVQRHVACHQTDCALSSVGWAWV